MKTDGDYWVHDLDGIIVQFTEHIALRYYGLAYATGFLCAIGLLWWYHRKGRSPIGPAGLESFGFALFAGVLIGGRLGFVLLYEIDALWRDPLYVFRVWEGGMASHGGFIGVCLGVIWFCRKEGLSLLKVGDLVATVTAPGLLFGRIANFINGELWGKVTDVSWAVIFPGAQRPGYFRGDQFTVYSEQLGALVNPRHPSQLYEAGLEGLFLLVYMQLRFWCSRVYETKPGHLIGEFFVLYAVVRVLGEQFREPDAALIYGLSRGSFYSLVLFIVGVGFIIHARRKWEQEGKLKKHSL